METQRSPERQDLPRVLNSLSENELGRGEPEIEMDSAKASPSSSSSQGTENNNRASTNSSRMSCERKTSISSGRSLKKANCSVKRARKVLRQKSLEERKVSGVPGVSACSGSSVGIQEEAGKDQVSFLAATDKVSRPGLKLPSKANAKKRAASFKDPPTSMSKRTSFHSETGPAKQENRSSTESTDNGEVAPKSSRRRGFKATLRALNPLINHSFGSTRRKNEDNLAIIFMGIILIFLICHFPRIINSLYEVATIHKSLLCAKAKRPQFSLWSLMMISISHVLLVFNSATNMLVYCLLSSKFRSECVKHLGCFNGRKARARANVLMIREEQSCLNASSILDCITLKRFLPKQSVIH